MGRLLTRLKRVSKGEILTGASLAAQTYFGIGGPAAAIAYPVDLDDLKTLCAVAHEEAIPALVLGGGSNMLVMDGGFRGLVINLSRTFLGLAVNGVQIRCGASVRTSRLVALSAQMGYTGLEGLAGVPGTVGGAIRGNAGTSLGAMTDRLDWVVLVTPSGEERWITKAELNVAYRRCLLPPGAVIVEACFTLPQGAPAEIRRAISRQLVRRNLTQPVEVRSAGCIFKNPAGDFAGRLIERAGLKGLRKGGAQISMKHGNFVVNLGGALAADVLWLVEKARAQVMAETGVGLELEIQVVGSPGVA